MAKPAVLNLEPLGYSPEAAACIEAVARLDEGPMDRKLLLSKIGNYDALIVRFAHRIDAQILSRSERLKVIACAATGTDHIDTKAANARGISILSLNGEVKFLEGIVASAEYSWALLMSLLRKLPAACNSASQGEWQRDRFRGHDLAGNRIALIGCGRIGKKTARYADAFGMDVCAYDPFQSTLPSGVTRCHTLEHALRDADIVMIHLPLNDETRSMFGKAAFSAMKPGAILINTARGEILDERELLSAIESGHLSGAALDVLADETPDSVPDNPLILWAAKYDNLLISPHIAGATHEAMALCEIFIAKKLADFLVPS